MVSNPPISITLGTRHDYLALQRFHYVANTPATIAHVLRATDGPHLIGVLVISMPTLNAWWRAQAWPAWLPSDMDARTRAHTINSGLRTISRVIVDPRWRAMGIATALVRHYLTHPLTPRTEAVASMAAVCPIFERAGMRVIEQSPPATTRNLLSRLRRARIRPWELMDQSRVVRAAAHTQLEDGLRKWADRGSATRKWRCAPLAELAARAGWTAMAQPVACVHGG